MSNNYIFGRDATNHLYRPMAVDSSGNLQVDVVSGTLSATTQTNTDKDGSGTAYSLLSDADGNLQVDIVGALPAGTNEIGKLAAGTASLGTVGLNAGTQEIGKLAAGVASIGTVGLNAGTAAIGKLAANDGVDIGDVDVASSKKTNSALKVIAQTSGGVNLSGALSDGVATESFDISDFRHVSFGILNSPGTGVSIHVQWSFNNTDWFSDNQPFPSNSIDGGTTYNVWGEVENTSAKYIRFINESNGIFTFTTGKFMVMASN